MGNGGAERLVGKGVQALMVFKIWQKFRPIFQK